MSDYPNEVDAASVIEERERARGAAKLAADNNTRIPGLRPMLFALGLASVAFVIWFMFIASKATEQVTQPVESQPAAKAPSKTLTLNVKKASPAELEEENRPHEKKPPIVQPVETPAEYAPPEKRTPTPAEIARDRRLTSGLTAETSSSAPGSPAPVTNTASSKGGLLADNMKPVTLEGAKAGRLRNRDLMITAGTMIDCGEEQKLITDQPGWLTCYLTRDALSTTGRVVLLDRGTKVVGQYTGALTQGQKRIFVLWTRAETPDGAIINLDSAGTGSLGEGGVGGWVDNHWDERIGAGIAISVLDDVLPWLTGSNDSGSGNTINFSNTSQQTQDLASEVVKNTINIKPTLYKNQGERVSIFISRDLDFSEVYSLERR